MVVTLVSGAKNDYSMGLCFIGQSLINNPDHLRDNLHPFQTDFRCVAVSNLLEYNVT
jgi:hypothetical protein